MTISPGESPDAAYQQAIAGEGAFWDHFIAQRLLRGEIPTSIDMRLAFNLFRLDHDWRPFGLGVPGINFRLPELHYILTTATQRPGMRVLDLGCGAGWLSLELARLGAHVTALDISPTNLAIGRHMVATHARNFPYLYQRLAGLPCRTDGFGSVDYAYADLNTVTLPKAEFDAVVVWDSLHHIRDLERLLGEIRGALKPGGVFLGVDHSFATPRTAIFNQTTLPLLDDFAAWVTAADPQQLYDLVDATGRRLDLGVLALDYDPTPVPGLADFAGQLRAELLDILKTGLQAEALEKARTDSARELDPHQVEAASPFEDVSADRLMPALRAHFHAVRFDTVCPWITPEQHVPKYRTEQERLFQHYLAVALIKWGEQQVAQDRADGQWFLFHLTAPPQPVADATLAQRAEERAYTLHLEAEIARKNDALAALEQRLQQREAELAAARRPFWARWR